MHEYPRNYGYVRTSASSYSNSATRCLQYAPSGTQVKPIQHSRSTKRYQLKCLVDGRLITSDISASNSPAELRQTGLAEFAQILYVSGLDLLAYDPDSDILAHFVVMRPESIFKLRVDITLVMQHLTRQGVLQNCRHDPANLVNYLSGVSYIHIHRHPERITSIEEIFPWWFKADWISVSRYPYIIGRIQSLDIIEGGFGIAFITAVLNNSNDRGPSQSLLLDIYCLPHYKHFQYHFEFGNPWAADPILQRCVLREPSLPKRAANDITAALKERDRSFANVLKESENSLQGDRSELCNASTVSLHSNQSRYRYQKPMLQTQSADSLLRFLLGSETHSRVPQDDPVHQDDNTTSCHRNLSRHEIVVSRHAIDREKKLNALFMPIGKSLDLFDQRQCIIARQFIFHFPTWARGAGRSKSWAACRVIKSNDHSELLWELNWHGSSIRRKSILRMPRYLWSVEGLRPCLRAIKRHKPSKDSLRFDCLVRDFDLGYFDDEIATAQRQFIDNGNYVEYELPIVKTEKYSPAGLVTCDAIPHVLTASDRSGITYWMGILYEMYLGLVVGSRYQVQRLCAKEAHYTTYEGIDIHNVALSYDLTAIYFDIPDAAGDGKPLHTHRMKILKRLQARPRHVETFTHWSSVWVVHKISSHRSTDVDFHMSAQLTPRNISQEIRSNHLKRGTRDFKAAFPPLPKMSKQKLRAAWNYVAPQSDLAKPVRESIAQTVKAEKKREAQRHRRANKRRANGSHASTSDTAMMK